MTGIARSDEIEERARSPLLGRLWQDFGAWRKSRPFWAGLWAVLGGLVIGAGPASAYKLLLASSTPVWLGVTVGLLIAVFGLFFWFAPGQRQVIGVLIVVLSVASLVTSDMGGFFIGMLMGIVGGAMGFAWTPLTPQVHSAQVASSAEAALPPAR